MTPGTALKFVSRLARQGIRGGAIYDAIVAESARAASAILVSADRRAAATYRAIGVEVQMLDE